MDVPGRVIHPLLVLALVLVAVLGYVLGSHRGANTSTAREDLGGRARLASGSGLLLEYPLGWQTAAPPSIPGLTLEHTLALSPHGTSGAGLLSGVLPRSEASPLPAAFLARLRGTPRAEVVDLVSAQAYRYSQLDLPGYAGTFDLYAIPATTGPPRLLACYAPTASTSIGQQCERIVSGVTLVGAAPPSITPEPAYAAHLAALVTALDRERLHARAEMSHGGSAAAVAGPAGSLAKRFSSAATAVSALEAPQAAQAAQAALASALRHAGQVYASLGEAASTESLGNYDVARGEVGTAEAGVSRALESFALLGYGPA